METETINFYSENAFVLKNPGGNESWIKKVISAQDKKLGEINFIFCDDDYLLEMNQKYLNHDTYTDIISFDNSVGKILHGDIFISTDRVGENADEYQVFFEEELQRVMVHGILHFCGYKDKSEEERKVMRQKEDEMMKLFHVEQ